MKRLSNKDDLISDSWLDDCVKHIYFFESVVLQRAKKDKNFTEQEIIDMIGWAITLDNLWDNEAVAWKLKELNHLSEHQMERNLNNSIYNTEIQKTRHFSKEFKESIKLINPSKRMLNNLLNNIRISVKCLEKFLRISAEHIPTLDLSEEHILLQLKQRDELKTMLKNCLYHFHTIEIESGKSLDSDKLNCLLNTIRNDSSILLALKLEKERLCIDDYQKELLSLAILCDQSTTSKTKSKHEQGCWSITTYFTSKILSSKNIKHQQQVDLLLWLDKAMFGTSSSPPLSLCHQDANSLELPLTNEESGECTRTKDRKIFFMSLKFS